MNETIPRHLDDTQRRDDAPPALLIALSALVIPAAIAVSMADWSGAKVLAIVVALCAAALFLVRPFFGLIAFLGLLYIRPEDTVESLNGMHLTLATALVTLFGMILQVVCGRAKLARSPVVMMVGGVFAAAIASLMGVADLSQPAEDVGRLLILVILILNLVHTKEERDRFTMALIVLSVYLSVFSIAYYSSGDVVRQDGELRSKAIGIFSDPNDLAATIAPAIALILPRFARGKPVQNFLYGAALIALLAGMFIAQSRGGMLALIVTAAGALWSSPLSKSKKIGLLFVCLVGFLAASGRMTNFDSHEESANMRFWFWYNGVNLLRDHPLLGVGYGQFVNYNGGMWAHNSFVQCFAELGLIGYFFWIGAIYFAFLGKPKAGVDVAGNGILGGVHALRFRPSTPSFAAVDYNSAATRLALAAYLTASFWLTHTFSPVLYVLLCLPAIARPTADAKERRITRIDVAKIAAISLGSIVFIKLLTEHYR